MSMTIREIANTLNAHLDKSGLEIAHFQRFRTEALGQKYVHQKGFFGDKTIFEKDEYAYHHGGRKEFQFNVGLETLKDGRRVFRYGLALTFERNQTVPDPIGQMGSILENLNLIIAENPQIFSGLKMWHFSGNQSKRQRSDDMPVSVIPEPKISDFFFIGQWTDQLPKAPDDKIFDDIVLFFNRLFPLYAAVQFSAALPEDLGKDQRLARLCWNDFAWQRPSGPNGKSSSNQAYEKITGFGHEEWFFDTSKLIDGWHYAYLRPIDMFWTSYIGKQFDVKLYSRNPEGIYVYIGEVEKLEVIGKEQAEEIDKIYEQNGWLKEMTRQAQAFSPKPVTDLGNLFNVRFRPENAKLYKPHVMADEGDIPFGRYMFYKNRSAANVRQPSRSQKTFSPRPPNFDESEQNTLNEIERSYKEQKSFREDEHTAIQIKLHQYLYEKFGNCTQPEAAISNGSQRIDLKFQNPDGKFTLLEIKTYQDDLRACIRTALGQLLEYAFYDDDTEPDHELIIVSQNPLDAKSREYFRHLREKRNLPIGYLQFDWETGKILDNLYCNL